MDRQIEKNLRKIRRRESRLEKKKGGGLMKPLTDKVEEKIPPGLYDKLQKAFYLGFKTVFQKGDGLIEKTYDREELKLSHKVHNESFETLGTKKGIKGMNKLAGQNSLKNLGLSAVEGTGLGLLGIGLPDIPIFIGVVLKSVYEVALSYGFDYKDEKERYFILKVMEAALAQEENRKKTSQEVDRLMFYLDRELPFEWNLDEQMKKTADCFATDMLCIKFIQGLPLVGVIGGITNVSYCRRISEYAKLKYQKRFLIQKQEGTGNEKRAKQAVEEAEKVVQEAENLLIVDKDFPERYN